MTQTKQWLLNSHPKGVPTYKGSDATFKLAEKDLPALEDGQVLLKVQYFSNDPAQRGWIDYYPDESRLYVPAIHEGERMQAFSLSEVIESKSDSIKKGDIVSGATGWTQYSVQDAKAVRVVQPLPNGLPITHYLGALGMTGLTAYSGLIEVAQATKDDVVVVSGAAGATGSMVVQIAKKILGCKRVVGIAGGAKKCEWVKKLGADECVDYKSADFQEQLVKATPEFANVYFDNVGGDILDFMLTRMARNGRIAACGAISNYNAKEEEKGEVLKNWFEVISMRLSIRGFIVLDHAAKFAQITQEFRKALEEGKLDITEGEHVVETKFEDVPGTWLKLFDGVNTGKLITKLV
ncbi:Putative NADP-dependent oxidoreductase YfmJ [Cytospora mali]|uniref:Dehydrogenase FUB6 n=1 Tax=Cytospora mali TaxID=578113 RepID=A0A194UNG7_CYTMA|nr:Putative NADP-dependent oxidoreductase YfmJ [Valsa mali var. pyri (nom. inval.)]